MKRSKGELTDPILDEKHCNGKPLHVVQNIGGTQCNIVMVWMGHKGVVSAVNECCTRQHTTMEWIM